MVQEMLAKCPEHHLMIWIVYFHHGVQLGKIRSHIWVTECGLNMNCFQKINAQNQPILVPWINSGYWVSAIRTEVKLNGHTLRLYTSKVNLGQEDRCLDYGRLTTVFYSQNHRLAALIDLVLPLSERQDHKLSTELIHPELLWLATEVLQTSSLDSVWPTAWDLLDAALQTLVYIVKEERF